MARDDSRLASLLGELADLGRRISDRAAELAGLMEHGSAAVPAELADRLADVSTSTADLAAAAAAVTAASDPEHRRPTTEATAPSPRGSSPVPPPVPAPRRADASPPGAARSRRKKRRTAAVPPAKAPSATAVERSRRLRRFMPAAASAAVNAVAILGLALFFVAAEAKPRRPVLTLGGTDETFVEELTPVEFEAAADAPVESEPALEPLPELAAVPAEAVAVDDVAVADAAFAADTAAVTPASLAAADVLGAIGGGRGAGEGSGRGGGAAGGGQPGGGSFFGRTGQGQSVCFICDNSNSYRDGGFHAVLEELARAVESLRPEQSFSVVFFSDAAYPLFHPAPVDGLQPATPENKQRLRAWLGTVEMCGGGQGIDEAVRIAARAAPEVVYFLSDGEHAASVVDRLVSADFGGAAVHTFGMQQSVLDRRTGQLDAERLGRQQGFNQNLVAIATAHGGTFTPVTVPPQAAALERLRPIRRNRAPGPIWGLKL